MDSSSITGGGSAREMKEKAIAGELFGGRERHREGKRIAAVVNLAVGHAVEAEQLGGGAIFRQGFHALQGAIHGPRATIELVDRTGCGLELLRHPADRLVVLLEFAAHGTEDVPDLA